MGSITALLDETAVAFGADQGWRARLAQGQGLMTAGRRGKAGEATPRDAAVAVMMNMIVVPAPQLAAAVAEIGGLSGPAIRVPTGLDDDRTIFTELAPAGPFLDALTVMMAWLRRTDMNGASLIDAVGVTSSTVGIWPWVRASAPLADLIKLAGDAWPRDGLFVYGDARARAMARLRRGQLFTSENALGWLALYRIARALDRERPRKSPKPRSIFRNEERPEAEAAGRSVMGRPRPARANAQAETSSPVGYDAPESRSDARERQALGGGGPPHRRAYGLDHPHDDGGCRPWPSAAFRTSCAD